MNSMWKRSFALLLSLVMVFGMVPVNAFAEETECSHSYETTVTDPTCTAVGYTTYTCACGDTYTADEVAATGHSYADGFCSVCGAEEHTHSYEAVVTAPTCTVAGFTTYTCACGDTYTADEVAATGHSYADGVCSVCGAAEVKACSVDENCEAETHDAECPMGPCTLTEGCELVKGHPGECTGAAVYDASNITTATELNNAVANGGEITLGADITLTEVILLSKSVTINGNGHKISSSATRVFRLTTENIEVTMNNVNMVNTAERIGSYDIRGVSIDNGAINAKLTLNGCSVDFTHDSAHDWSYAVNDVGSNNCEITISGGSYEGANVFNINGSNHTINISGVNATSLYKPNGGYMGVVVKLTDSGSTVTVSNSTFNGGHAKAFEENNSGDNDVTFTGLTNNLKYYIVMIGSSSYYTLEEASNPEKAATLLNPYTLNGEAAFSSIAVSEYAKDKGQTREITLGENGVLKVTEIDSDDGVKIVAKDVNSKVIYEGGAYRAVAKDRVASIGDVVYESLAEAVAAAADGDTITLAAGEYELPLFSGKELTFVGSKKEDVIVNDAPDARAQGWNGSTFHFKNLTAKGISGANTQYHGLANGVVAVTYENCNVKNWRFLYAPTVSFDDCTFDSGAQEHSFWTYSAQNITVTDSVFNYADRAVNCYSDPAEHTTDISFSNCEFNYIGNADAPAGAVEINSSLMGGINVYLTNCDAPEKGELWFIPQWDTAKGAKTEVYVDGKLVNGMNDEVAHETPSVSSTATGTAAKEIVDNGAAVNKDVDTGLKNVDQSALEGAVAEELVKKGTSIIENPLSLETSVDIQLNDVDTTDNVMTFNVKPVVTAYDSSTGDEVAKAVISNSALPETGVTFRLPVPTAITTDYVTLVHTRDDNTTETFVKPVVEKDGKRCVELTLKSFSKVTMSEPKNVAAVIGETSYESVGAAVAAVQEVTGKHTIKLLSNCTGDITVKQHPGVEITIDGKNGNTNHTFSGSIIVQGNSTSDNTVALNIQNINFDVTGITGDNASIMLASGATTDRYTNNVTVSSCSFTDTSKDKSNAAIKQYQSGCSNVTITGCTAIGLHSLVQIKSANNLEISGCNVTESKNGISVGTSVHPEISDCVIDTDGYGIRANTKGEAGKGNVSDLKVEGVTITANDPIVVRYNTAKTYEVTLNGTNSLTGKNAKGYTVIFTEGDDGTYLAPTNGGFVVAGADENMFPAKFEAMVGNYQCYTLQDAVNFAAKHGGTVTLIPEKLTITKELDIPETSGLKFDLTGKTLELPRLYMDKASTVTITGGTIVGTAAEGQKDAIKTAHSAAELTLNGVTVQDSDRHVVRIEQGTATLNNCTIQYTGKESKVSRILINVGDSETKTGHVTINGGTYEHTSTTIDSGRVVDLKTNSTATITDGTFKAAIADKVSNLLGGNADSYSISGGTYKFDVDAYCADGYYSRKIADKEYQVGKIVLAPEFKWTPDKDYLIDTSLIVRMPEGYTIPAGTVATVTKGSEEVFELTASTENGVAGSNALIFTFANRGQINSTTKAPVAGDYKITLTDGTNKIAEAEYKITGSHPATAMTVKSYDGSAKTLTLNVPALLGDYAIVVKKGETVISNGQQYCTGHETKDGKFALTTSTDLENANGTATLKNFPTEAGNYTVELRYRKGTDAAISLGEVIKSVSVELCTVKHGTNTETVLKGTQYTLPAAAEATGKTFKAWKVTDATGSKEYAANAKFTVNSNAEFEVVWNVAASIGDKTYDTLSEALSKATAADTVVVGATAADGTYTIPAGVTVSVNGNKVKAQNDMTMKLENGKATFTIPARTDSYLGMAMVNDKLIYITKENNASTVSVAINKNGTVGYTGTRIESDSNNYQRPLFEIKDIDGSQTLTNSHVTGTNASMTFKCNAPFGMFHYAFVTNSDGSVTWNMVRDVDYSVVSGSTVMTVNNGFMKKLPVGTYVMHMVYTDSVYGEIVARANFYVTQPAPTYVADKTNPKTGDEIFVPMFVMFSTAAALAVLVMGKKKYL
ncbi:MAG: hypothetical protein U0N82_01270 [Oscillospiraceae bacterium]